MRFNFKTFHALSVIPVLLIIPTQTFAQSGPRFADPPWGNMTYAVNERYNKAQAEAWFSSNDPNYVALRSEIDRQFPLWARSRALDVTPDSLTISPGRFAGELNVSYAINRPNNQGKVTIQAQLVSGQLCLGNAGSLYKTCDHLPSSQAEADNLYAETVARSAKNEQDNTREKQEAAIIIAGSATRRPGSPLNSEDKACMRTLTENYQAFAEGACTSGYMPSIDGHQAGPYVCTGHDNGHMVTLTRSYEKNVCSSPISFRDQCGSMIMGSYTVQPGARFDRKFSYPCGRVY